MKIKIKYPQITFLEKEVEISGEKVEELKAASSQERAVFIWGNLSDNERIWTNGEDWIADAIDAGYAGIFKTK